MTTKCHNMTTKCHNMPMKCHNMTAKRHNKTMKYHNMTMKCQNMTMKCHNMTTQCHNNRFQTNQWHYEKDTLEHTHKHWHTNKTRKHLKKGTNSLFLREMITNLKVNKTTSSQSKKGGKDQESIQSSTTPDPGYNIGK